MATYECTDTEDSARFSETVEADNKFEAAEKFVSANFEGHFDFSDKDKTIIVQPIPLSCNALSSTLFAGMLAR